MDYRSELRGFLSSRRARLTPAQAGVPTFTGTRRVPGLRREEVAHLAGISVDYYVRFERGKIAGVSGEVLDAIACALQLDDVEREHLVSLVRAIRTSGAPPRKRRVVPQVRPELQRVLDALPVPALLVNNLLDVVAANDIGWAVYPHTGAAEAGGFNLLRFQLLDDRAPYFYAHWEQTTGIGVALLRSAAGANPDDKRIAELVSELSVQSDRFRSLWSSSHDVQRYRHGTKHYRHPTVGALDFEFESFDVPGEPELTMLVYTVAPNSPTANALQVLAS